MTLPYIPHLILAGLMGIHCNIITVRDVSVKAGGSITIPCLYEPNYRDHVKYLCKGANTYWPFCSYAVKTNQPDNSGKFSISDDSNQTTFTVTINDLTDQDTYYWCAVEIKGWPDVKQHFHLSVTTGVLSLYMDHQEITAFERGSVTIVCHYKYQEVKTWCWLGSTCVTGPTGSINGAKVAINTSAHHFFTVVMSELKTTNSGWYLCANRDFQMPVHISVRELTPTTTTAMSPTTANFTETVPTTTQHSSLPSSVEPHTAQPPNSTINGAGGESLQDEHKSSTEVTILITTLVLLLIVPAAFFGWRVLRRNKTEPEGPDITAGSQTGSDPDVLYTTVVHNQHVASQKSHVPEESVTYSTIVIKDGAAQMTEPADGSVIYSTVNAK